MKCLVREDSPANFRTKSSHVYKEYWLIWNFFDVVMFHGIKLPAGIKILFKKLIKTCAFEGLNIPITRCVDEPFKPRSHKTCVQKARFPIFSLPFLVTCSLIILDPPRSLISRDLRVAIYTYFIVLATSIQWSYFAHINCSYHLANLWWAKQLSWRRRKR